MSSDIPIVGLFLWDFGPKVEPKLATYRSLSPSDKVFVRVSFTRLSGSYLLLRCTVNPLLFFSVLSISAFLYLSSSF